MADKTKIFISGVGGQGSITTTLIIGEAAAKAGLNVVASEIHGMAQRGGIVQTTVLIGDLHGAMIPDGGADILIAFEPAEAVRFLKKASKDRTTLIMNEHPIVPIWVSLGREAYPALKDIQSLVAEGMKQVHSFDGVAIASEAGTSKALGAVMLGALAGLDRLPISKEIWLSALMDRVPSRFKDANQVAFDRGFAQTQG
ncbi:MAG: indolepyruvate oxidoreductase subunit beta [Deltaproteobacteria bacterium]|nr:indolepyruvate oxidoreductase subunit beta [Deltaproteobacteria bacterium]